MIGKSHTCQTLLALKKHIILIKTMTMILVKNIKVGKIKLSFFVLIFFFSILLIFETKAIGNLEGKNVDLKILDKISSKNELIKLTIDEEFVYKDLAIKSMKCTNSEFDDIPEIKAYIQVRDLTKEDNNNVFVFNGWMFSSSPSIAPFDHPVYDIWLVSCY